MTADHKRRVKKLEAAVPDEDQWSKPWRAVMWQSPTDPKPVDGPDENLLVWKIVAPRHEHDPERPDCNCLTCWEVADAAVGNGK